VPLAARRSRALRHASLLLGLAYSANHPVLRWKRSPFLAAACILVIRALAVQFGFYLHIASVLDRPAILPEPLLFASAFMCFFSVVIAFFKDIPDVAGDAKLALRTTAVRFGERKMLDVCRLLLLVAYAGAAIYGLFAASLWCRCLMVGAHALLAQRLCTLTRETDVADKRSLAGAYMGLWKLFYAEYALLPFWCGIAAVPATVVLTQPLRLCPGRAERERQKRARRDTLYRNDTLGGSW